MARGIQQVYYYDNEQIKYIYKKAQYSEENKLIISFSAFSSNGAPPQYSYVRTFEGIDVNQLFVLDTGHRGSYYLGIAPYFTIEKAVVNLIETIIVKENIKRKDIICIGSSKGGWAALYYGIKMNLGYVIAGEPQVFIVDYLKKSKGLDVLDYISNNKTDCYSMINNKLINLLYEKEKLPKLMLHAGSGGYHYQNHVLPFLSNVKSGIIQLDIQEYSEHDNVAKYFPKFLMNNVLKLCTYARENLYIENVNVSQNTSNFICNVIGNKISKVAFYVYRDNKLEFTRGYEKDFEFIYSTQKSGKYQFRVFTMDKIGNKISKETSSFII